MKKRLDNRGSALVTVLIAVTFMSILVTTLLYVAVTNYKTKQVAYQNKTSFYLSEAPMEEIKVLMIKEASLAFENAYGETLKYYATKNADDREDIFKATFVDTLMTRWTNMVGSTNVDKMKNLMTNENQQLVDYVGAWTYDTTEGTAEIGPIQVSVSTDNGYTMIVSASIYIEAPDIDLSRNSADTYSGTEIEREDIVMADYVVFKNWSKQ